ncbi:antitoxin [Streptomyces sp. NPDC059193]|uniref:antitoxin n=1 Tax=Streptomyces sp. NPDC059193 TaxID=3346763 RepID=UPI00369394CD
MGTPDNMKDKAKDLAKDHQDVVRQGIDKAGDFVHDKHARGPFLADDSEEEADKQG